MPSITYRNTGHFLAKARWIPWILLIATVVLYFALRYFERELTHVIIPFFPVEEDKSFGFYRDLLRLSFNEMLWLSFFILVSWLLYTSTHMPALVHQVDHGLIRNSRASSTAIAVLSAILALLIARFVLQTFPNSADEYVYLHQAETISTGNLTQKAHALDAFFRFNHLAHKDGITVGRFPPGWPLLLSLPFLLDVPAWWLNPLLAGITLWVLYGFANRFYGKKVAVWSLLSMAPTGYFLFNSASYFSHTSCLLLVLGFVYSYHLFREKERLGYATLAGVLIGAVIVTRYLTAVLVLFPVVIALIYEFRWRAVRPLLFIGLGAVPMMVFLFWYNNQITGSPFLPVTVWVDPAETLGFVKGHTFLKGVEHLVRRAILFFYWSSPALLILYCFFLLRKALWKTERFLHPEDYYLALLFAGYFFYHHPGGNQYGPRFLFEAYPFVAIFVVKNVLKAHATWPMALWLAGIIYSFVKLPYISEREHRVITERLDLYRTVAEAQITEAVIFVSTHTSVIRPMPPGDLTRNGLNYQRSIIYARDRGKENVLLMAYYPDRTFYRYIRDPEETEGKLVRLK